MRGRKKGLKGLKVELFCVTEATEPELLSLLSTDIKAPRKVSFSEIRFVRLT